MARTRKAKTKKAPVRKVRRKTKIICTLGPSSNDEKTIEAMIKAGMNGARINCSHSSISESEELIKKVQKVRDKLEAPVAIIVDLSGPELRIGNFTRNTVILRENDEFTICCHEVSGNKKHVSINYDKFYNDVRRNDQILLDDGLVILKVKKVDKTKKDVICTVTSGGILSGHKSVNVPGRTIKLKYINATDRGNLLMAARCNVDYIACSFVSEAANLKEVRDFLKLHDGNRIGLLAKIENQIGIDNIDSICEASDGIMVARGDLFVEIDFNHLSATQKYLINKTRVHNKPVIVCTEMLESMITKPRPTRAEVSDCSNAVYDGASALMLSGETAAGEHPVLVIRTMHDIAKTSENSPVFKSKEFNTPKESYNRNVDALAHSACTMSKDIEAKSILCFTERGYTPRTMAHFKPEADTIAVTNDRATYHKMAILWGVHPFYQDFDEDIYEIIHNAKKYTMEWLKLKKGSEVILIIGWAEIQKNLSSTIQIAKL